MSIETLLFHSSSLGPVLCAKFRLNGNGIGAIVSSNNRIKACAKAKMGYPFTIARQNAQ